MLEIFSRFSCNEFLQRNRFASNLLSQFGNFSIKTKFQLKISNTEKIQLETQYFQKLDNIPLTFPLGSLDSNFPYAETILSTMLGKYPDGIYFHFFAGRMEQFKGNYEKVRNCSFIYCVLVWAYISCFQRFEIMCVGF